jgi:hypothetical protein
MIDLKNELYHLSIQHWLNYEFLTWRWFLKIFIIAFLIFIFYKFIDRKRIFEIVAYGTFIALISTILDIIGTYLVFWEYPVRVLPIEFSEIHDIFLIPIIYMLAYQYFIKWKSFIIANTILAIFASFVIEPLFILLNFYKPIEWKHIYSVPLFLAIAIMNRYIIDKLKSSQ